MGGKFDKEAESLAKLQQNTEDRQLFEYVLKEGGKRFWELCHEKQFPEVVEKMEAELMTRPEIHKFGKEVMTAGIHKGEKVREVPREYLEWWADIEWAKKLNLYLRSTE